MLETIGKFFEKLIRSLWDLLTDFFLFVFELCLEIVTFILSGIGSLLSFFDPTNYLTALPADVLAVASAVGIGEASSIVVMSLLVRLSLQLIPFVRLGS